MIPILLPPVTEDEVKENQLPHSQARIYSSVFIIRKWNNHIVSYLIERLCALKPILL